MGRANMIMIIRRGAKTLMMEIDSHGNQELDGPNFNEAESNIKAQLESGKETV